MAHLPWKVPTLERVGTSSMGNCYVPNTYYVLQVYGAIQNMSQLYTDNRPIHSYTEQYTAIQGYIQI